MEITIETTIRFCPVCRKLISGILSYCGECGTKVKEQEIIICMEEGKVTRILKG